MRAADEECGILRGAIIARFVYSTIMLISVKVLS